MRAARRSVIVLFGHPFSLDYPFLPGNQIGPACVLGLHHLRQFCFMTSILLILEIDTLELLLQRFNHVLQRRTGFLIRLSHESVVDTFESSAANPLVSDSCSVKFPSFNIDHRASA